MTSTLMEGEIRIQSCTHEGVHMTVKAEDAGHVSTTRDGTNHQAPGLNASI